MVDRQKLALVVVDGAGVLANIAGVVNPAGKLPELALLDGFERANTDFGGLGDLPQGDARDSGESWLNLKSSCRPSWTCAFPSGHGSLPEMAVAIKGTLYHHFAV